MGDLDISSFELACELHVVVPGQADRRAGVRHRHDQPQDRRSVGPAVAVVAHEHSAPSVRRRDSDPVRGDGVAELCEQSDELVVTPVDVPDDVERPMLGAAVRPKRGPGDLDGRDLLKGVEHPDVAKPLALEVLNRAMKLRALPTDDVRPEGAIGSRAIALKTDRLRWVKHDRDREQVVRLSQFHQRLPGLALHVRCIDDREPGLSQAPPRDEVQNRERITRGRLIVFVIRDQATAEV